MIHQELIGYITIVIIEALNEFASDHHHGLRSISVTMNGHDGARFESVQHSLAAIPSTILRIVCDINSFSSMIYCSLIYVWLLLQAEAYLVALASLVRV